MTAGGEKIQRYWLRDAGVNGAWMTSEDHQIEAPDGSAFVLYADHVAGVIAELKAMASSYCLLCEMNIPMSTERGHTHERPFMDGGDPSCTAWQIHARIAELEKEGK